MEKILFGVEGVRISVDDVIIHAPTMPELVKRLRHVFERCRESNLKVLKESYLEEIALLFRSRYETNSKTST